jgi:hypothetical protein
LKKFLNNLFDTWCAKWPEILILAGLLIFVFVSGAKADHGVFKDDITTVTAVCPNEEALLPLFDLWLMGPEGSTAKDGTIAQAIFEANGCVALDNGVARIASIQKKGIDYEGDNIYLVEINSVVTDDVAYSIVWHNYIREHASQEVQK